MLAHGIDIIEISRIGKAIDSWGARFLKRMYTKGEIKRYRGRVPELAARFAGKEAVMKALGTGHLGISPCDIEILTDERGAPSVSLSGGARARAEQIGLHHLVISLSHCREYAIASVVGERQ